MKGSWEFAAISTTLFLHRRLRREVPRSSSSTRSCILQPNRDLVKILGTDTIGRCWRAVELPAHADPLEEVMQSEDYNITFDAKPPKFLLYFLFAYADAGRHPGQKGHKIWRSAVHHSFIHWKTFSFGRK